MSSTEDDDRIKQKFDELLLKDYFFLKTFISN